MAAPVSSFVRGAIAFTVVLSAVGCVSPRTYVKAEAAWDRGELDGAVKLYKLSLATNYLTPDEYDRALDQMASAARTLANNALDAAPTMTDSVAGLELLCDAAHRYSSMVKDGPLKQRLALAIGVQTDKAWGVVEQHASKKQFAAGLYLALRIATAVGEIKSERATKLTALREQTFAQHDAKASEAGDLLGLRAVHEGLRRWASPEAESGALKQLDMALKPQTSVTGQSGCGDTKDVARRINSGAGSVPVTVELHLNTCKPGGGRSSRMETYRWTEKQAYKAQVARYRTVYRVVRRETCKRPSGKPGYYEMYDCSQKQATREITGYDTVTKYRDVQRSARRQVTTQLYSHAIAGSAVVRWAGRTATVSISERKSRTERSHTGPNAKAMPSGHTAESIRSDVLRRAADKISTVIADAVRKSVLDTHAKRAAAASENGANSGDPGLAARTWLDAQAYLIRAGAGDPQAFEKRLALPAGTAANAVAGTLGFAKNAGSAARAAWIAPPRRIADTYDIGANNVQHAFAERGTWLLRLFVGYRTVASQDVPLQANREVTAGSYYGGGRWARPANGVSPMFDVGFASYVGKRTSEPQLYADGEQEWALSGGLGWLMAARLGFRTNRFGLYGGLRLDYMWHAMGDLHAAAWTAPLSVVTILRFHQRLPVHVEVWGNNLFSGNDDRGIEVVLSGALTGLVFRWQQAVLPARYGGVLGDDIVSIGAIPVTTMDIGMHVAF